MKSNLKVAAALVLALGVLTLSFETARASGCAGLDVQAHRGAPGYPENTVDGLVAALSQSYTSVEIDTYSLLDGTHVLQHDPVPGRTLADVPPAAPIATLTRADWEGARIRGYGNVGPSFLSDALDAFVRHRQPHQRLNIEVKDDFDGGAYNCARIERLHQEIAAALPYGSWSYSTPHIGVMQCMTKLEPKVYVGYVIPPSDSDIIESHKPLLEGAKFLLDGKPALALAEKWGNKAREAYQQFNQAAYLSPERLEQIGSALRGRGGVHMGVRMIEENFDAISNLNRQGVAVYTYGIAGDDKHAYGIIRLQDQGMKISGAIIDGDPDAFCAML